jgi:hypothetical protein
MFQWTREMSGFRGLAELSYLRRKVQRYGCICYTYARATPTLASRHAERHTEHRPRVVVDAALVLHVASIVASAALTTKCSTGAKVWRRRAHARRSVIQRSGLTSAARSCGQNLGP